nr:NADH dehydrogenase subunit 1 [Runcina aurata]
MLLLISNLFTCLCVLLSVAFYTLLERKVLGLAQIRKGPNKVGYWGIFQPLSDAVKLFIKESFTPLGGNKFLFSFAPSLSLLLSLSIWYLFPSVFSFYYVVWGLLLFICISSLNVYATMISGWSSNSIYAFLGCIRASAQTISYEVSMLLIILFPSLILFSLSWYEVMNKIFFVSLLMFPVMVIWFISILAETNRAPFDFAEGESELVSGFNVEYGSGLFALLFMAEYASILFMSMATCVWFFSFCLVSSFSFLLVTLFFSIMFLVVRGSYPRLRYDYLMTMCWKQFLPFSLCLLMMISLTMVF